MPDALPLIVFIIIALVILRHIFIPPPILGIPYNWWEPWLPFGNLVDLGIHQVRTGEVFDWLSQQCVRHGSPVVQIFMPPFSTTRPVVIVADLREIEDIVTKRCPREMDRADSMRDWFGMLAPGATIGMRTGSTFKQQRRLWNSILSPGFMSSVTAPCFHAVLCRLIRLWDEKAQLAPGLAFEAVEDIRQTTLEAMNTMLTGSDLGLLNAQLDNLYSSGPGNIVRKSLTKAIFRRTRFPAFYNAFSTLLRDMDWVVQGISPRGYTWIFNRLPFFINAKREVSRHLDTMINEAQQRRLNTLSAPRCALDSVLRQEPMKESVPGASATSHEALHDELFELLITGHETTASSAGWALKYLTDNQEIQTRLRDACLVAFPSASITNLPSADDLAAAHIPYLDASVAEILRISGTGPVSFRQACVDIDILGHHIPAGTPLVLVTAGPSYDNPALFSVAEKARSPTSRKSASNAPVISQHVFAPERWLDADGEFNADAELSLPFSAGPRGCFGKKIALLELKLMIALFIISFRFPKLPESLSRYTSRDGLTRKPTCCHIMPEPRLR